MFKCWDLLLFYSLAVQTLRQWNQEEMDNAHHMCYECLYSPRNSLFSYLCFHSQQTFVFLHLSHQKRWRDWITKSVIYIYRLSEPTTTTFISVGDTLNDKFWKNQAQNARSSLSCYRRDVEPCQLFFLSGFFFFDNWVTFYIISSLMYIFFEFYERFQ